MKKNKKTIIDEIANLPKFKSGTVIRDNNMIECRLKAGYMVKFEILKHTYKISQGYINYGTNADYVEQVWSYEFNKFNIDQKRIIDNVEAFIKGER